MKPLILILFLIFTSTASAQFVPSCSGTNDTSKFITIISLIGANTGTIELPFKDNSRCAVNNLTIPANISLDNTAGTGIKVNAGQLLTVLGSVVNPVGKQMFFGPGSTSFSGNAFIGGNGQALTSDGAGGTAWTTITGGGGGGGAVDSVFGRTGTVIAATGDYTWAQINKSASSIEDLTLRSADLLSNGVTGTGAVVLADSATLTSPVLNGAIISTINGLTITPSTGTLTIANGKTITVNNTLTLAAASDGFTLTVPATGTAVLESRTITEGAGLAGNTYDLSANRTLALGTPSTLSVSSLTSVSGTTHSHAITSSSNPGAAASLLASDANGHLQLARLGIATPPTQPLEVGGNAFINAATANMFMKDTSTGWQVANTLVITPQANNCIRSTNFTSGLVGFNICAPGNAEFDNVDVRGAIHAGLIVFNAQMATAGTLGVFRSAAKLRTDVTVPSGPTYGTTTVNIDVVDGDGLAHGASQLFAVNDILRMKDGLTGDTWFRVASVSDQGTFWRYTSTIMAGSNNATYRAGLGVADYGASGSGFIIQTADQTNSPYLQMATHLATFTSNDVNGTLNVTPRLRTGNLNGSYGYVSDTYGFAAGPFGSAGQTWLTVDTANGIRIGNNTTTIGQWAASGDITVGQVTAGQSNILISAASGLQMRTNTTPLISLTTAGNVLVGQQASGQSNVFISSGALDLRNNTTVRARLASDGSGFLANSSISWDTAGNLTVAGNASIASWTVTSTALARDTGTNSTSSGMAPADFPFFAGATVANRATAPFRVTAAGALTASNATITGDITANTITANTSGTIAGWTINSSRLSNGTTHLAANFDIPAPPTAWFGRTTTDVRGVWLQDSSSRTISMLVNGNGSYPVLTMHDGTRYRVALGGLNFAWGSDGATNSMGMKIWNNSGTKIVEFSDAQNVIGGWSIGASVISSSTVNLDSVNGISVTADSSFSNSRAYRILNGSGANLGSIFGATSGSNHSFLMVGESIASEATTAGIQSNAPSGLSATVVLQAFGNGASSGSERLVLAYGNSGGATNSVRIDSARGLLVSRGNIGASLTTSVALEVNASDGAFLPPKMTTTQRDALTPTAGMVIYNTTVNKHQGYNGTTWNDFY